MSTSRESAPTPPSTAWAAAQQAFSHREQGPADKPVVIVRKGRVMVAAAAAPDGAQTVAPRPVPADKPARVFRVAAAWAVSDPAGGFEDVEPALQADPRAAADTPRSTHNTRKRRVVLEKRPGPVLSIVHALPALEAQAPVPDQVPMLPLDDVGAVIEMFASVDAILDDIKRARAFRFVDADLTSR